MLTISEFDLPAEAVVGDGGPTCGSDHFPRTGSISLLLCHLVERAGARKTYCVCVCILVMSNLIFNFETVLLKINIEF